MFDTTTWVRIGAGAFVLLALGVAAVQTRDGEPVLTAPLAAAPTDNGAPLVAALERCQGSAAPPATCEPVWAENRRRFLGLPGSPTQGAAANEPPARVAP